MISIIDYRAGNLTSVRRAFDYLGIPSRVTDKPGEILSSERVVFPGVGAAGAAMQMIRSTGLDEVIQKVIAGGIPFLGICLGAQIILTASEENDTPCLDILPGKALHFSDRSLKIPHMGWNSIMVRRTHPVLAGIDPEAQFYFVHSYYPSCARRDDVIAATGYGISFHSVIGRGNVLAMQFHPEKSGRHGLAILRNFAAWKGGPESC